MAGRSEYLAKLCQWSGKPWGTKGRIGYVSCVVSILSSSPCVLAAIVLTASTVHELVLVVWPLATADMFMFQGYHDALSVTIRSYHPNVHCELPAPDSCATDLGRMPTNATNMTIGPWQIPSVDLIIPWIFDSNSMLDSLLSLINTAEQLQHYRNDLRHARLRSSNYMKIF